MLYLFQFNNTIQATTKMADYLWTKQEVTLDNIANMETPGYKAKYVTFEEELGNKFKQASTAGGTRSDFQSAIGSTSIRVNTKDDESYRLDGNGVNLDVEQAELASTQLYYNMAIKNLSDEFSKLRTAMR